MRRRPTRSTLAFALTILVALVAACSSSPATPDAGTSGPADTQAQPADLPDCPTQALHSSEGPVRISVWAPQSGPGRAALDTLVARFQAEQHKVTVEIVDLPSDPVGQRDRFRQAAADGHLPTVAALDSTLTQFVADSGAVVATSECRNQEGSGSDTTLPVARNYYTSGDSQWGGSPDVTVPVLFFRRDALTQAGLDPDTPPRTLTQLEDAATQLRKSQPGVAPLVLPKDPALIENWLTGANLSIVDHNDGRDKPATAGTLDGPRTLELYQWLQDMVSHGLARLVDPAQAADPATVLTQASMVVAPSSTLTTVGPATVTTVPDLDVAPLPGLDAAGKGQLGGVAWYLSRTGSPEARAAGWAFIRYLGTVPSQATWNLAGSYLPSNIHAVDDPALTRVWASTRSGPWLDTAYTQLTNLDPTFPGPLIGPYVEVRAALAASIDDLLAGRPPQQVVSRANRAITEALSTYRPGAS